MLEAEKFADWDAENVEMVLDEALKIAQEQMGPCNEDGDRIGAQYDDGKVTLPESFKPVFQTICEGGWIGLLASPEFGGMGLPDTLGLAVNEFFNGSNVSLSLTLMLTRGAGAMIEGFGTDEQKALFVEKLFSGEWTGTMCLTEAQAGSDVGASTTKAVKQDDGSYAISGEKIFITGGDHNLVDNIIHLVLARTPDAPAGTKGLSLFIIPKVRVNPDGSLGDPNDVFTNNIEEKMGIHGSPTCTLVFGQNDGCQGFLLGEELQGMKLMFHLMNAARILTEGEESERYNSYVEMLTPICKAWCSEWGVQVTHWCLQVHGGYGYTSEYPAEQFMRDAEIACIYEGTNGIQALDFVARKLPMNNGQTIRELLGMAESTFKKLRSDPEMMEPAWMLAAALKQIETISKEITKRPDAIQLILLNAPPLLDMVGTVLGAHYLMDQAILAKQKLAAILEGQGVDTDDKKAYKEFLKDNEEAAFYHNKVQTAIHFAYRALPTVAAKGAAIRSGEKSPFYAIM
jgi:alkylation response protein AidB-like acyl-CoA dehydrogenase